MSARRSRPAPDEGGDRWLATYGDMITLLMAFFVMLFALSSVKADKFEAFLSGLDQFGNPAAAGVLDPIGDPVAPPAPVPAPSEAAPAAPVNPAPAAPTAPLLEPALERLGHQLLDAVATAGFPGTIEIRHDPRGLAVAIGTDDVLFDIGATRVTEKGLAILRAVAPTLGGVPNEVLVEGHADTTPLDRGGYTNWNLSTDRAVAVVNVFVGEHGFPPHRLTASGFGEFRPLDPADHPEAKTRNRRVELIVRTIDAPGSPPAAPTPVPQPVPPVPEQTS